MELKGMKNSRLASDGDEKVCIIMVITAVYASLYKHLIKIKWHLYMYTCASLYTCTHYLARNLREKQRKKMRDITKQKCVPY